MKLYTEEQVKRIAKLYRQELYVLEAAINTETPIEIPSDEEIAKKANQEPNNWLSVSSRIGLIAGAKWLKNKILNQNK